MFVGCKFKDIGLRKMPKFFKENNLIKLKKNRIEKNHSGKTEIR